MPISPAALSDADMRIIATRNIDAARINLKDLRDKLEHVVAAVSFGDNKAPPLSVAGGRLGMNGDLGDRDRGFGSSKRGRDEDEDEDLTARTGASVLPTPLPASTDSPSDPESPRKKVRFDAPTSPTPSRAPAPTPASQPQQPQQPTPARPALLFRQLTQAIAAAPASPAPAGNGAPTPSFWHDDGDLILVVGNPEKNAVRFRVHAMRLAAASSVFGALLRPRAPTSSDTGSDASGDTDTGAGLEPPAPLTPAAARPPFAYAASIKERDAARAASKRAAGVIARRFKDAETMPVIDETPAVHLEDDAPRDWAVALEASYDFLSFLHRPVLFDTLASALRISTKYDIKFLRDWAVAQLRMTYPLHLDQMAPTALPRAADAIALARAYAVPSVLPAAFYALSLQRWRTGPAAAAARSALSQQDLAALVAGRETLQDVLVEIVGAPLCVGPSMLAGVGTGTEGGGVLRTATGAMRVTYPPSPAPSPAPHSPTTATAAAAADIASLAAVPAPPPSPPLPPPPPTFTFCSPSPSSISSPSPSPSPPSDPAPAHASAHQPPCRAALSALWRRALAPDASRPWGTWVVRELHRMAALPRDTLGSAALGAELRALGVMEGVGYGYGADGLGGGHGWWPEGCIGPGPGAGPGMGVDGWLSEGEAWIGGSGGGGGGSGVGSAGMSPKLVPTDSDAAPAVAGSTSAPTTSTSITSKSTALRLALTPTSKSKSTSTPHAGAAGPSGSGSSTSIAGPSGSGPSTPKPLPLVSATDPSNSTSTAPKPLTETERGRRAEARAPVCAACWEENRRLARWRLDWLCEAVPRMFGFDKEGRELAAAAALLLPAAAGGVNGNMRGGGGGGGGRKMGVVGEKGEAVAAGKGGAGSGAGASVKKAGMAVVVEKVA